MRPQTPAQWCKFFDDHEEYTNFELAFKYSIPAITIRRWRKACNKQKTTSNTAFLTAHRHKVEKAPEGFIPVEIWDNAAWMREHYINQKLGIVRIKKLTGAGIRTIRSRLRRYEIPLRSQAECHFSRNPLCNREWLFQRYVTELKTQQQCAEEAGVNDYTIIDWLVKFKIRLRPFGESMERRRRRDIALKKKPC